jgi:Transposase DNA-binding
MDATQPGRLSFGHEHFAAAALGDQRRTKRLVRLADRLAQPPGGTLPEKLQSPADLEAWYRLVRAKAVTHRAVLEPARQRTLQRMRAQDGVVLTIHDPTELDYAGIQALRKRGQIGNGSRRGYRCHNTLAVAAERREVLGLANQILAVRPKAPKHEGRPQRRQRVNRETRLWKPGAAAIGPAPPGKRWVDICDRGADLFA